MNRVKRTYPTQIVKYNHRQPLCKGTIDRLVNNPSKKRVKIEIIVEYNMAFSNQSGNNNFHNSGGESAANIVSVYERVFSTEPGSKYGNGESSAAKRCAVRVVKFENLHGLRVGFSKQWFASDLKRWLPS